jgi:hypothetical protein
LFLVDKLEIVECIMPKHDFYRYIYVIVYVMYDCIIMDDQCKHNFLPLIIGNERLHKI